MHYTGELDMKRNIAVAIAATAAMGAMLFATPQALAATAAGTKVSNSATVAYKIGTVAQTAPPAASADFLVDRKVNLTVTEVGGAATTASPGELKAPLEFLVTNSTNDAIDVKLDAATMAKNTVFDAGDQGAGNHADDLTATEGTDLLMSYKIYTDAGLTTELSKSGSQYYIDELAPAANMTVYVVATEMPAIGDDSVDTTVQDDDIIVVKLTGTAHSAYAAQDGTGLTWDTTPGPTLGAPTWVTAGGTGALGAVLATTASDTDTKVDNVLADNPDLDLGEAVGTPPDGIDAAYDAYKIGGADITVTKRSAVYWDPINLFASPKAIPGSIVLYCITVKNAGSSAADEIAISDTIPTNTTFENGGTDTDSVTPLVQPLDPDGDGPTGAEYPPLSDQNSIRFSTSDSCAVTDWDLANAATLQPVGSSAEDDSSEAIPADGPAWAADEPDGAIGNYNSVTPKITTTVKSLGIGSTTEQFTTTMFLVKVD
jgi:uncharacterized repeat protein (TIGR01451 family)